MKNDCQHHGTWESDISTACPDCMRMVRTGLKNLRRMIDGSQPKDIPGAVMVIDFMLGKVEFEMNKEEFSALLDGREYLKEITREEEMQAYKLGLVVVYGASDDLVYMSGAISGEIGAYGGQQIYFNAKGLLVNECGNDDCPHFREEQETAKTIDAIWDQDGYSWTYKTKIPHATFDVMEDGEKYCRGIVFSISDLA